LAGTPHPFVPDCGVTKWASSDGLGGRHYLKWVLFAFLTESASGAVRAADALVTGTLKGLDKT